jgi:hypothetical protein
MGDTITLNTRILLAMKGFCDEAMIHGGSGRARNARKSEDEGNMVGA